MSVEVMGGGGSANLQSKSILPSLLPYTQTPDPGYDGLSSVEVLKPSTLIASNIKKGVSIFNVTGTALTLWTQLFDDDDGVKTQASVTMYGTVSEMNAEYIRITERVTQNGVTNAVWTFYSDAFTTGAFPGTLGGTRTLHGTLYQAVNGVIVGSNWTGASIKLQVNGTGDGIIISELTTVLGTSLAFNAGDGAKHNVYITGR